VSNLVVVAPGCDKTDVGESWVGYQWVHRLARRFDVTLLTYYRRDRVPPSTHLPGVRVVEWAEPPGVGRAERLNSMLKPGYVPFLFRARRWLARAQAAGEHFDVGFQPLPVAMRYPSPLAGSGIPFVIGPLGGSLASPPGFASEESTAAWYTNLRVLDAFRLRHDPMLRRTYVRAGCVLGIAGYVADALEGVPVRRFETMSETGIESLPEPVDRSVRCGPVRLLFVGRIVRTKGVRDAIRAMALLRDLPVLLDVVGDGSDRSECEQLADELALRDVVRFHGWCTREETQEFYRAADVFCFPSYREPGGNVVFEAMSFGLPLIVCKRGGPGNVVDDSCGLSLSAESPQQLSRDLAAAARTLVNDSELRASLGAAARRKVAETAMWERKVDHLELILRRVATEFAYHDRDQS
jgi:glycosyltransferase involved in cell wall biosynthesis